MEKNSLKKYLNGKMVLGTGATLAVVGLIGIGSSAGAFQGDYSKKGPNYSEERHQAMEEAFLKNDYNAWKELMIGRGRVMQVINEDNFSKFAEARRLAKEGNIEKADEIRKELGLRTSSGEKNQKGYGRGQGKGMRFNSQVN